jgi:ubiquinone/menaquinone biosynthesis C-methylase UbiE
MERILDLGCGAGDSWRGLRVPVDHWQVIGVDIQQDRVQIARHKHNARGWRYLCARGENVPLANASVNGVFCEVALPYMHIPRVLAELHRVLAPGGWLRATLHPPSFTWGELKMCFPNPKQTLFRVFVLLNGMVLHCCGGVISVGKMAESCQTDTGIRTALRRAGFTAVSLRHEGPKFYLEARREEVRQGQAAVA